ncbi:methyl-accepting chemotaxis protein [Salibacterium salarium]|uniref:methyl-accepting chemotaxis protein n=1 Tax=Salibacterium salarium TaxID=284579 RepID=UPI00278B07BA|nr:methyl-accepting chemotaxis protein [Salibacterium salarium]MDQ0298931.1 methyl-accepting chemotaxis protein [Salibacterium salarium]
MNIITSTIKRKLIVSFLLVGLIPMGIAAYFIYQLSSDEIVLQEEESMEELAQSTASGMEQWLDRRLSEIKLTSQSEDIKSENVDDQLQLMNYVINQEDTFETVVFTDPEGIVRAHTTEDNIDELDLSDREYFQNGMSGNDTISDVLVSNSTGNRIVVVASPVEDDSGEIIGVLSASVNFEALIAQYLDQENNELGNIEPVFVDGENTIQLHKNEDLIGTTVSESGLNEEWVSVFEQGKEEQGFSIVTENNGDETLSAFAPIPLAGYGLYLTTPMDSVLSVTDHIQLYTIIITIVAAVVIIFVAAIVAGKISNPIRVITEKVKQVADGDLSGEKADVKTNDEVGELTTHFNTMTTNLREIIQEVEENAEQVSSSSEELTASAEQSSQSSEDITQSIQQVASGSETQKNRAQQNVESMEEVSRGVEQMASSATEMAATSAQTLEKANEGGQAVQQTVEKMQTIHEAVTDSNEVNQSLGQRSKEIESILSVISDISEQTNLLALNAAIEAARAGEHGKGFAVVAEQVRKLAEESQQSSNQISNIIGDIQQDMEKSTESTAKVTQEVEDGMSIVNQAKERFEEIRSYTQSVGEQIEQIAATSEEISSSSDEVTAAFREMTKITEETSSSAQNVAAGSEQQLASMEEIDSAAQSLSKMATDLQEVVNRFKLNKDTRS